MDLIEKSPYADFSPENFRNRFSGVSSSSSLRGVYLSFFPIEDFSKLFAPLTASGNFSSGLWDVRDCPIFLIKFDYK